MLLGVLQGYNIATAEYVVGGIPTARPKDAFCVASSALPVDYDDISAYPEYWANYGLFFVGTLVGFKDWNCLQAIVKSLIIGITGADFVNWDSLTSEQKIVAMKFIPTKLIDVKGSDWFMTQAGGLYQGKAYLDSYQTNAEGARNQRLKTFGDFGYYGLGKDQGLQLERQFQLLSLDKSYTVRGVLFEAEDTVEGLGDWVLGTNGFGVTGLKPQLIAGTYNLLNGFPYTIAEFCDVLAYNILQNGQY